MKQGGFADAYLNVRRRRTRAFRIMGLVSGPCFAWTLVPAIRLAAGRRRLPRCRRAATPCQCGRDALTRHPFKKFAMTSADGRGVPTVNWTVDNALLYKCEPVEEHIRQIRELLGR